MIETKTLFVAMLVGLAHIICGIAVMTTVSALNVTPLSALVHIANYLGYVKGGFAGAIMVMAGIMAVIGSSIGYRSRQYNMALFVPQQLLLMLQLYSITVALITGVYPDGYRPQGGAFFILSDQIWAFLLAASHSVWLAALLYLGGTSKGGNSPISKNAL